MLYDIDGSLAPHLPEKLVRDKVVEYYPRWPERFPVVKRITRLGWKYCAEQLAYDHCMYKHIGDMDWAAMLVSPDVYAFMPQGRIPDVQRSTKIGQSIYRSSCSKRRCTKRCQINKPPC